MKRAPFRIVPISHVEYTATGHCPRCNFASSFYSKYVAFRGNDYEIRSGSKLVVEPAVQVARFVKCPACGALVKTRTNYSESVLESEKAGKPRMVIYLVKH